MLKLVQLQRRCIARCLWLPLELYLADDFAPAQKDLQAFLNPLWTMETGTTFWNILQRFWPMLDRDCYGV